MGRTAARQERTPFPAPQHVEPTQPATTEHGHTATTQTQDAQSVPAPQQKTEPKQPTSLEEAVRLRAYELYLERGAIPGDEVRDWLQAERELLTN
jgi:hypothetical protein